MNETYSPDRWVILRLTNAEGETQYRVHSGWYSEYLDEDYWRVSSSVEDVVENNGVFAFTARSGAEYICNKSSYGMSSLMGSALDYAKSKFVGIDIEVLEEDQLSSLSCE